MHPAREAQSVVLCCVVNYCQRQDGGHAELAEH